MHCFKFAIAMNCEDSILSVPNVLKILAQSSFLFSPLSPPLSPAPPHPSPPIPCQLYICLAHVKIVGGRVYYRYGGFLDSNRKLERVNQEVKMIVSALQSHGMTGGGWGLGAGG